MGIYAIPEISSVGMDEAAAAKAGVEVLVGRAKFEEIARGQISGIQDGMLKMVAERSGKLLGVQIVGEGATELIHIAQMGLLGGFRAEDFVENIFNFPTLAEAYRVAALQITAQLPP
jgi:NAD(P) transhydrogenase